MGANTRPEPMRQRVETPSQTTKTHVIVTAGGAQIHTDTDVMIDEGGIMFTLGDYLGDEFRHLAESGQIESLELKIKLKKAVPSAHKP